jgi:hypothetical protein
VQLLSVPVLQENARVCRSGLGTYTSVTWRVEWGCVHCPVDSTCDRANCTVYITVCNVMWSLRWGRRAGRDSGTEERETQDHELPCHASPLSYICCRPRVHSCLPKTWNDSTGSLAIWACIAEIAGRPASPFRSYFYLAGSRDAYKQGWKQFSPRISILIRWKSYLRTSQYYFILILFFAMFPFLTFDFDPIIDLFPFALVHISDGSFSILFVK